MATKYHNSPNGPRLCKAQVQECPYGSAGGEHYATFEEAQTAYEAEQIERYGTTVKIGRSDALVQKAHREYYTARERGIKKINKTNNRLKARVRLAKASPKVQQAKKDFTMLMNDVQKLALDTEKKTNQFKNRLIAHYRVSRMRSKELITNNMDRYRKIEVAAIKFDASLAHKMKTTKSRFKNMMSEASGRVKAASVHQKAAVQALRSASPAQQEKETVRELTKLNEATKGRINPEIVDEYFKGLENARKARHRADVEPVEFAKPGQGRRKAEVKQEESITI